MRLALFFILPIVLLSSLPDVEAAMYSFVDQDGKLHFSNVPADPRYREVPGYEAQRSAAVYGRYGQFIKNAAARYGLDPELITAVIKVESRFNPYAVSEKGAMGLMQLMPQTAREMQVGAPFEAEENIMGGSRYLRKMLNLFEGNLRLALAAYNAGPNRVLKNGIIPKIPETELYVKKVMQEYGRNRANFLAREEGGYLENMKNLYTVPNILTACRFAIVPVLLFMLQPGRGNIVALAAFFLFLSGALTDLADGYLARKYGIESVLGKLMDPLADKMLVATPLIMLIPMGRISAWVSLLIISRELAVTGLRGLAAASGIVVSASGLGKIKSVFQYTALCILIFPLGLLPLPFLHDLGRIILYVSLLLTLWSGFDYFVRLKKIYLTSTPDA